MENLERICKHCGNTCGEHCAVGNNCPVDPSAPWSERKWRDTKFEEGEYMTDQETRFIATCKKLVANGGVCAEVDCENCPGSSDNNGTEHGCSTFGFSNYLCRQTSHDPKVVESAKKYLAEHMEKDIIGWPGNAEEMRQYLGREVLAFDVYSEQKHGYRGIFSDIDTNNALDLKYIIRINLQDIRFRYIKILPEPTTKEYTMDEVLKMAGLDPNKVRVKG